MNISKINIFLCMFYEFISECKFIIIHWIEEIDIRCNSTLFSRFRRDFWDYLKMFCCWSRVKLIRCSNIDCCRYTLLNYLRHHFTNDWLNHFLHILIDSLEMLTRRFDFAWRKKNYEMWWFFMIRENLWITIFQFLQYDFWNFVSCFFK